MVTVSRLLAPLSSNGITITNIAVENGPLPGLVLVDHPSRTLEETVETGK